jgi:hypothetical protein
VRTVVSEPSDCNAWARAGKKWMMHRDPTSITAAAPQRLEDLFRRHEPAVVAYVRRRAPADPVDDMVAETFLIA